MPFTRAFNQNFHNKKNPVIISPMETKGKISVIFMGTPQFAVFPLQILSEHKDFDIKAVVTQKDKKVGRKQILTEPIVKTLAKQKDIPVLQPNKVKDKEFIKLIKEIKPDFIVVVAFGKILPKEILEIPKYGTVNIHASLLPKYRGASPIQEALLNGDTETGITIMELNEKLDEGGIYLTKRLKIENIDDAKTLSLKLSMLGALLTPLVLIDIEKGNLKPIPQDNKKTSYCSKIEKEDGEINFTKETAEQIKNKIRAFSIWPNCFTFLNNKRIKILKADTRNKKAHPGEIVFLNKKEIGIGTKSGLLIPKEVQIEGKKVMTIEEFLRGHTEVLLKTKSFTSKR